MITAKDVSVPNTKRDVFGTSTEEGSKKTKQEEGKKRKRVRNAQLQRNSYCLDSRGSHRELCHQVAFGNQPANAHLSDGCKQPCESREGSVRSSCGAASEYKQQGDGSETGIVSQGHVCLKQPQEMGRTELEIVTGDKQVRFHPYAVWSSLARTD